MFFRLLLFREVPPLVRVASPLERAMFLPVLLELALLARLRILVVVLALPAFVITLQLVLLVLEIMSRSPLVLLI